MVVLSRLSLSLARLSFRSRVNPRDSLRSLSLTTMSNKTGSRQIGLGAFLQKGVKMVDHIKVEVPKASSEDGKPEKRTSGRKRTTKAEKDAELAAKAKKP